MGDLPRLDQDVEFTHRWYRAFLDALQTEGYRFRTFEEEARDRDVFLRHDVDLSVDDALTMARLEADLGVVSTYCVLVTSPLYNPLVRETRDRLRAIEALGHDVGLHFSTHQYWGVADPPARTAIEARVEDERRVLETAVTDPVATVSFHIPPDWVLDREFEGFLSTYAPAHFSDMGYRADSSQRWRDDPPELGQLPSTLQLLTHPGLWGESDAGFERRVEQAISASCTRVDLQTRREFLDGVTAG